MVSSIVSLIRFASTAICVIVIVSFGSFAIDQAQSASTRQQEQLAVATTPSPSSTADTTGTAATAGTAGTVHRESAVHKTLEEASRRLTSPFSGVVSESSSEWAIRGAKLMLALLVYGFGLGYLARMLRVRV